MTSRAPAGAVRRLPANLCRSADHGLAVGAVADNDEPGWSVVHKLDPHVGWPLVLSTAHRPLHYDARNLLEDLGPAGLRRAVDAIPWDSPSIRHGERSSCIFGLGLRLSQDR
jgi:hypothetical protein